MSNVIEGFAVETVEGLLFTVKGLVHPPDRVIAYLRYVPHPQGDRERDGTRYRRLYRFQEQRDILRCSDYVWRDPVFGIDLQGVPHRLVRAVYDPCNCVATLRERGPTDPVEKDALALAELVGEVGGISPDDVGISGSVMVGMHRDDSDVDLVIYGEATGRAAHRALRRLMEVPSGPLRRPSREQLAALHAQHRPDTPLSFAEFARLQRRKVNEGRFRGREVFVRFVKHMAEVDERYGDRRFRSVGFVTVRAKVTDDREAIFTPCRYAVTDVTVLDGPIVTDLREIVSFRGRFSDQVRSGEWAVARGNLERVLSHDALSYHRLVVGGRVGDYLTVRTFRE